MTDVSNTDPAAVARKLRESSHGLKGSEHPGVWIPSALSAMDEAAAMIDSLSAEVAELRHKAALFEQMRDQRNGQLKRAESAERSRDAALREVERLKQEKAAVEAERDEAVNWTDIVSRHGTDQFDDIAEAWLALEPIQRVHNAVASVFSKWANDELMTRFKQHMSNTLQMAFVEGCLCGVRAAETKARAARSTDGGGNG